MAREVTPRYMRWSPRRDRRERTADRRRAACEQSSRSIRPVFTGDTCGRSWVTDAAHRRSRGRGRPDGRDVRGGDRGAATVSAAARRRRAWLSRSRAASSSTIMRRGYADERAAPTARHRAPSAGRGGRRALPPARRGDHAHWLAELPPDQRAAIEARVLDGAPGSGHRYRAGHLRRARACQLRPGALRGRLGRFAISDDFIRGLQPTSSRRWTASSGAVAPVACPPPPRDGPAGRRLARVAATAAVLPRRRPRRTPTRALPHADSPPRCRRTCRSVAHRWTPSSPTGPVGHDSGARSSG